MRSIVSLIILVLMATGLKAQKGAVVIVEDPAVDSLVMLHQKHNAAFPVVQGYRIQLFKDSGNEALDKAREIMDKFKKEYPGLSVYLSFQEPYYRVRVGDFKTRLEALDKMSGIKKRYKNVWIISDNIHFSHYKNKELTNTKNHE